MNDSLTPRQAAEPPAPWFGGKKRLAAAIVSRIAAIPHQQYIEPFGGMGGVFLRRPFAPPVEVVNDVNGEIVNLFRVLQRHYREFVDGEAYRIASRAEFERLRRTDPATLTDLERAARFLYLQRLSFGGHVRSPTFGVDKTSPARFDTRKLERRLSAVHRRLAGVTIEHLPWEECVRRYDDPAALFYLDPPYWGHERDYGKGLFGSADFHRMAATLSGLDGKFLLSINGTPEIREIFEGFAVEEVRVTYSVARGKGTPAAELIVSNVAADRRDLFSAS